MTLTLHVPPTDTAPALTLRRWREDDIEALIAAYADPAMRRWLSNIFDDEAGARRWLTIQDEGWDSGRSLTFAIVEDGTAVGHLLMKNITVDGGLPTVEVGYWTLAAARGRGIAPRTVEAVSQWLFGPQDVLRAEVLELLHRVENEASCRVAEKSGFALESILEPTEKYPMYGHRHVRLK